jgi:hypothetical protein
MEPLLGLILDQLKNVVNYSGSAIMALEENLTILSYRGLTSQKEILQMRFPLDSGPIDHEAIRSQEPIIIPDVRGDIPLARVFRESASRRMETTLGYI